MPIKAVAVLGAGVTGLAATAKFIEMGYQVTLIEKRKICSALGGGLDIHPNGTKVLFSLGITEILKNITQGNSRGIKISNVEKKTLNCIPLNVVEKNSRYPMVSFLRSDLLNALFNHVKNRCKYYEETECIKIDVEEDSVELGFDRIPPIRVDLVIAADGINSIARRILFPNIQKQYLGHIACGGRIPRRLYQHNYVHGLRRTCVVFPCTTDKAHTLVFCDKPEGWLKTHTTFESHKEAFMGWSEEVDQIISNIDPESRFCIESYEVPPLESYVFKRVFLAGDAAHSMSPLGALATSLALEDVQELADQFSNSSQTLQQMGENYNNKRIPRAKQFRDFSLQNLVPCITEHNEAQYRQRMERFTTTPPNLVFAALINLTQGDLEPEMAENTGTR